MLKEKNKLQVGQIAVKMIKIKIKNFLLLQMKKERKSNNLKNVKTHC